MNYSAYIAYIPLLPLATFVILGLAGKKYLRSAAGMLATLLILVSCVLSVYCAYHYFFSSESVQHAYQAIIPLKFPWLYFSDTLSIDMGVMMDPISVMMIVVVTFVSLMVHVFSLWYM